MKAFPAVVALHYSPGSLATQNKASRISASRTCQPGPSLDLSSWTGWALGFKPNRQTCGFICQQLPAFLSPKELAGRGWPMGFLRGCFIGPSVFLKVRSSDSARKAPTVLLGNVGLCAHPGPLLHQKLALRERVISPFNLHLRFCKVWHPQLASGLTSPSPSYLLLPAYSCFFVA